MHTVRCRPLLACVCVCSRTADLPDSYVLLAICTPCVTVPSLAVCLCAVGQPICQIHMSCWQYAHRAFSLPVCVCWCVQVWVCTWCGCCTTGLPDTSGRTRWSISVHEPLYSTGGWPIQTTTHVGWYWSPWLTDWLHCYHDIMLFLSINCRFLFVSIMSHCLSPQTITLFHCLFYTNYWHYKDNYAHFHVTKLFCIMNEIMQSLL